MRSLVEPGRCQLGPDPVSCRLLRKFPVSPTSAVFRFELPDKSSPLNLSTCACLLARRKLDGDDGETVVRPYTPISTNADVGYFDLLVKRYEGGKMSAYMHDELRPGSDGGSLEFFHIDKNVKKQASEFVEQYDTIVMLVGGTGITPMIQALHAILGSHEEEEEGQGQETSTTKRQKHNKVPKVVVLYGSKTSDDILGGDLLRAWSERYGDDDRFRCVDVLSDEPEDSPWDGERGYVGEELLRKYAPAPSSESPFCIFVCGPPPMYDALCGPREEADKVTGLLGKLGYEPRQVYKF